MNLNIWLGYDIRGYNNSLNFIYFCICYGAMIDRELGFGSPARRQPYYFQFWPNFISLQPNAQIPAGSKIKFAVYKGPQKFNENKTPIQLNLSQNEKVPLKKCQLNFYLPDFNPSRKIDFVIKLLLTSDEEETEAGTYHVSTSEFVNLFTQQKINSSRKNEQIGQFVVDFDIFTEKTRYNLEKVVKQAKQKEQETETETQPQSATLKDAPSETSSVKKKRFERFRKEDPPHPKFRSSLNKQVKKTEQQPPENQPKTPQKANNESQKSKSISRKTQTIQPATTPYSKPQQLKVGGLKSYPSLSEESAASPGLGEKASIAKRKMRVKGETETMKESEMKRSTKSESKKKEEESKGSGSGMYNIKIIIFLLLSFFLMYEAMVPSRRAPPKKYKKPN